MNKYRRLIRYATYSTIVLALIWGLGPYVAIAGIIPFGPLWARIIPTLLVLGGWSSFGIMTFVQSKMKLHKLPIIKQTKEALAIIKKHFSINLLNRNKPAFFLLLGKSGSGKTTLLTNTETGLQTIQSQSTIGWWLGKNEIFIDPPGELCFYENKNNEKQWQYFLNFLKSKHRQPDGIIVVVNLLSFTEKDSIERFSKELAQKIQAIPSSNYPVPLRLIVTQCDKISGFLEFFSDLSHEERQQSLGLTLSSDQDTTISKLFTKQFKSLMSQINNRLIWLLHHEKSLRRRSRIKEFPLGLERLGNQIKTIVDHLALIPNAQINSIYFTSSMQSGSTTNLLTPLFTKNFPLLEPIDDKHLNSKKPYFIKTLFKQSIKNQKQLETPVNRYTKRLLSYPVALLFIFAGVMIWHHAYNESALAISNAKKLLSQPMTSPEWLSQLNTLQKTLTELKNYKVSHYRWIGLDQGEKLYRQANQAYQKLIRTNFVLYLDQLLAKQIKHNIGKNQTKLYDSLEVYLMFAKPSHLEPNVVKHWFKRFWEQQYPENTILQKELMQHLNYLLHLKHISWPINYTMLYKAQADLQKRPLAKTAFLELQTRYKGSRLPIFQKKTFSGFDTSKATIPSMYSLSNFNSVSNKQIPHMAMVAAKGNWVMGNNDTDPLNKNGSKEITKKFQQIYLQDYSKQWKIALGHIQLKPSKNLNQVLSQIKILKNDGTPIWKALQQVTNNAKPNDPQLQKLNEFLHKDDNYKTMQAALSNLQHYLNNIETAANSSKLAYNTASKRMQNNGAHDPITTIIQLSKRLPTPVNQWVKSLAQNSWKILLNETTQYINSIWTASVFPEYKNKIANRFPIFEKASQTISIKSFNRFFGPEGTLESFFNYYLEPFVNTSNAYWTWKSLDGEHISISQKKLDMLIRASMIQKMFYSDNPDKPEIKFTLTPVKLSHNIRRFILNVGGQTINYKPGIKKTRYFSWPGPSDNFVTMRFDTLSAHNPTTTLKGTWAWLRLLSQSQVQMMDDPKTYQVTFDLKGNKATYQLKADNPVNPYLPNVLTSFRCPKSL